MILKNKILSNGAWIISCKIIQSLLAMVISMLTARYLGASNFGIINYAASVIAFFSPVANLGINSILVKELVNQPEKEGETLGTAMMMNVFSAILCMLGVAAFSFIVHTDEKLTILVCILYSAVLLCSALEIVHYWFQAKYMSKYVAVSSIIAYVGVSLYKIFLLVAKKEVYWFALSNAIDYLLIAILIFVIYVKKGGPKFSFSLNRAKEIFKESKHYIVATLMVTIFAQTDKIMLKFMIDDAAVGFYSVAVACANLFNFVFLAIMDSMRPAIFESQKHGIALFEKNVSRLYCVIIYLSLLQCIVMTVFARPIITILYGNGYLPAIPALQIIVWYTTFSFLGTIRNIWMLAENKQKYLWMINMSGALGNVLLNAIFIPMWGILGAAFASLLTQIFTNIIVGYIIKPIRRNNYLMIKGLDPRLMVGFLKETDI